VGAQTLDRDRARDAFERLKTLRKTTRLAGFSWKDLRDEGRR
jgi:hypothetical protein